MAPRLPPHTIERIRHLVFDTDTPLTKIHCHSRIKVSRQTVNQIRVSYELFGTPYPPSGVKRGRPSILNAQEVSDLLYQLQCQPTYYLDELAWYCFDSFDKVIAPASISKLLKRLKWTKKKVKEQAAERSAELRAAWEVTRAGWRGERLCFVDESACNERSADRKYGWAPKGLPSRT
jgi:transposase